MSLILVQDLGTVSDLPAQRATQHRSSSFKRALKPSGFLSLNPNVTTRSMSSDENKNPTLLKLTTAFLTSCTFSTVAPIKSPNSLSRWHAQRPSLLNGALRNSPLKGLPLKQRNVTRWRSVRDHSVTFLNHDQSTTLTKYQIYNSIYLIVLIFLSLRTTSDIYILL